MSTLYFNGRICSDGISPTGDAILIDDAGYVTAVGEAAQLRSGSSARGRHEVDLRGDAMLPGFTDAHVHFASWARELAEPRLDSFHSLAETLNVLHGVAQRRGTGAWIQGGSWDANLWAERIRPTRQLLDERIPNNPVAIHSKDWHAMWLNTLAMQELGLDRTSEDIPGGVIVKDNDGKPTGLFYEAAAWDIARRLPGPSEEELVPLFEAAQEDFIRRGYTAVHIMDGEPSFSVMQKLHRAGNLKLRCTFYFPESDLETLINRGIHSGYGDRWLRIGGIKLFVDGSLGSQTAYIRQPYEGKPDRGVLVTPQHTLVERIDKAARHGLATATHAIGDAALDVVLTALERAVPLNRSLRHRVEHCQLVTPDLLERLGRLGLVASMQPTHCTSDLDLLAQHWGSRARYAFAFKSILRAGGMLAFGSDTPVEVPDIHATLRAAVTRQRVPADRPAFYPEEALTLQEAIRAFTWGGAYAGGEESWRGELRPGFIQDHTIISPPFEESTFTCKDWSL